MMPLSPSSGRQQQQRSTLSASGHARHADAYGTFHADGSGDDDDDFDVPARVRVARGSSGLRAHTTTLRTVAVVGFVLFAMSYVLTAQDPIIVQPRASPLPVNNNAAAAPSAPALDVTGLAATTATERTFLAGVDTTHIREFLHAYASRPHPAGSAQDYATAVYTAKQFEAFGLNATIQEYYPLLSLPVRRSVAIVAPPAAARVLNLTEAAVPGDTCTADADALPPFLAYAASGNVTASVVYANFGRPEDFDWLVAQNVSLRGKIALVRYGGNFRGLKVMAAEAHGCAGVLIYSDPHEDGFTQGAVYPDGPWRPAGSFQRGSVQYNSLAGGDPLTPGWASKLGAPYLNISTAPTIPHIPALPLSYEQATYILASLGGMQAPSTWQGALVLTTGAYRVGDDGATVVNLDLVMDNKVGPIWDVIGTIDGVDEPDARVLIGNHRDAWVCGAVDPSSGSAVMLEVARNLGTLLETGWRPRRTLVLASWDGEEYGLLGSTEYAEDHAEVLARDAVAYINVDNVVGPFVMASGTPSIAGFLLDTAKSVPANLYNANTTELTLYEQWVNQTTARRAAATTLGGVNAGNDGTLGPDHMIGFMGSGTDFTAFYQHLGIISANLGYVLGAGMYGTYHSTMDSLAYMERVGDPTYATHKTTTQWWGLLALRLADALVVPFDFTTYALVMDDDLASYAPQIDAIHGDAVDLTPLQDAIKEFGANAELFQARVVDFATNTTTGDDAVTRRAWNAKLVTLERQLLSADGLPHRPWFKHVIFGPGFYEGYGGTAFPGIDDAIAFKDNATTIQTHVDDVASIVRTAAAFMVAPLVLQ